MVFEFHRNGISVYVGKYTISSVSLTSTQFFIIHHPKFKIPSAFLWASPVAQTVKHLPAMQETLVRFLGWEDPLEKEMAIHSSTLAWKIPRMEEPDRLQSMGSKRVGHDWATSLSLFRASTPDMQMTPPLWEKVKRQAEEWGTIFTSHISNSKWSRSVVSDSLRPHGLPGSSVHGIFQAIVLEWIAISFTSRSSRPRDWTWVSRIVDKRFTVWATREVF